MPTIKPGKTRPDWCKSSGGNVLASDLRNKELHIIENVKVAIDNESLVGSIDQAKAYLSGAEKTNLGIT